MTIQEVFEAVGAHAAGKIDDKELNEIESAASPGRRRVRRPVHRQHDGAGVRDARASRRWARRWCPPRRARRARWPRTPAGWWSRCSSRTCGPATIITRASLENAIAGVAMTGGSTNAVLHLLAVANEAGVELDIDDFDRIAWATPLLADLKPFGTYVAPDLWRAGGVPLVAARLEEHGSLQPDTMTVTGQTVGEAAAAGRGDRGSARGAAARRPAGPQRRLRHPARQPGPRRLRGQAGRPRPPHPQRPGAGVRGRGRRVRDRQGRRSERGRRRGHPQRGPRPAAPACARCWR